MANNPAKTIIDFLGGARVVAAIVGKHPSRVYRWTYPSGKREGFAGLIPAREQVCILKFCRDNGIDLLPVDFFDSARLRSITDAAGAASSSSSEITSKLKNSPVLSSAGDGGVPLVLTDGTPQPISRSPEPLQTGDTGVQLQSPRGCTPDIKTSEVINDRL